MNNSKNRPGLWNEALHWHWPMCFGVSALYQREASNDVSVENTGWASCEECFTIIFPNCRFWTVLHVTENWQVCMITYWSEPGRRSNQILMFPGNSLFPRNIKIWSPFARIPYSFTLQWLSHCKKQPSQIYAIMRILRNFCSRTFLKAKRTTIVQRSTRVWLHHWDEQYCVLHCPCVFP